MDSPLFSILVANYNNGHFFKDCYESIINQTYSNWECIIVDDGSTDNSVNQIKAIIGKDNRFKIYENEANKKCGYTKNRCAALAAGEILGFLDPDDALTKDALEVMITAHLEFEDVVLITSKYAYVNLDMSFQSDVTINGAIPEGKSYLTSPGTVLTSFATFKNKVYQKTVGINVLMTRAVDQDLYYKMEEQGKHLFINKVLYYYRKNENSISANENSIKARYWHCYAKMKASERRNKTTVANLTKEDQKLIKSKYYYYKYQKAKKESNKCNIFYFYFKVLVNLPKEELKIKLSNKFKRNMFNSRDLK